MTISRAQSVICLLLAAFFLVSWTIQAEEKESFVLDTIIVTATRSEKEEIEIPAATQVFTTVDIKEMGAKTLLDVISSIPGFTISRSPSGNGSPGFRGIKGYLTILINGIPLANEGTFKMGSFASSGIERIEVVRGGSAVLYGSDATTGVVNIITKKDSENSVSLGAGNNGKREIGTFLHVKGLSLSYDHFQEKQRGVIYHHAFTGLDYYGDEIERDNINFNYELNEHLNLMFFHSKRQSLSSKYFKTTGLSGGNPWQNELVYDIGQISFTDKNLKVVAYGQNREWSYVDPTGKWRGRHYGIDAQNKWDFEKLSLTAGANFDYEKSSRIIGNNDWAYKRRDKSGIFFLAEKDLLSETRLLIGAREVFSSISDNVFCPQFQILHGIGDSSNIYLNINKSLREPNLSQRYGYSDTQEPNENLDSEIGWTYEIGWKRLFNSSNIIKLAIFHMEIEDRIYSSRTSIGKTIYLNAPKFKSTGSELSYRHNNAIGFIYGAGFYYGDPKQKNQDSDDWEKTGYQFSMNLNAGYRFNQSMVNATLFHTSKRSGDLDPIWDLGLTAGHNITEKDKISFRINNIMNRDDEINDTGGYFMEERNFMLTYERKF